MLDELHVRDYALVRDARLVLSPGCTVLTGETGAGKTALVGALKLLIGERGDVAAIRDDARELLVEGRFVAGDEEYIVTRRLNRESRSRCTLNDGMVTVGALAEHVGPLVDLHGQHEHQSLLSVGAQRAYLDRYAREAGQHALAAYQQAWDAYAEAEEALEGLRRAAQTSEESRATARHTVREIEAVAPQPNEYEELEQQLPILRNGEALALASQAALDALRGVEGAGAYAGAASASAVTTAAVGTGALDALATAQRALAAEAGVDARLDELASQLESLAITADDLAVSLRAYRESVEFDPQALEQALDRLGALEGLRKRYGPRMADVFDAWQAAEYLLQGTEDRAAQLKEAERVLAHAAQELAAAAAGLAEVRGQAADDFAAALSASFKELAMEGASVVFSVQELPRASWTRNGSVRYELLYRPTPTSLPRPLAKIASGGELSRVMLALKCLLKDDDEHLTLVFDEVDAGIGGVAAVAVAERVRALAASQQVVVITHLAQIAAVADRQFVVEKTQDGEGGAATVIREVTGAERVAELARMLAGATDEVALEHARRLLGAREGRVL
ncbi:MAG: DNA repair protein RecN [Coriobacteriales bacterium]|jgi:DNA repair protein RecN (Recombination protein N)|nr:DNA repair protein RecN [Coriobacteriales bacterium]